MVLRAGQDCGRHHGPAVAGLFVGRRDRRRAANRVRHVVRSTVDRIHRHGGRSVLSHDACVGSRESGTTTPFDHSRSIHNREGLDRCAGRGRHHARWKLSRAANPQRVAICVRIRVATVRIASRCTRRKENYARQDSNLQPSVPKTDALSNCATGACVSRDLAYASRPRATSVGACGTC